MSLVADLHVHSTASDGELTPSSIVAKAASKGITALALTDHDTVDGLPEAHVAASIHGVTIVPGIELSTQYKNSEVHILGYFIQPDRDEFRLTIEQLRQARHQRAREILRQLNRLGMHLSWDQVLNHLKGGIVGRPHIARALVSAGYVQSVQEAFECYLEQDRPAYVPRYRLSPQEAIQLIHDSNGAAVLAHPGILAKPSYLPELLELNWQGIEVFHPDHTDEITNILQKIAQERNLIPTGGSDFHCDDCHCRNLGARVVNETVVLSLKRRCRF